MNEIKLSEQKINLLSRICFIVLIFAILLRLVVGIDFSDESYYAFFLDDWLKGSVASSTFLTIHQTAAFIIYPISWVYFKLHHSISGLFLFLRCLFLFFTLIAALAWIFFLRRLNFYPVAWLGGIIVLAFIPFGLPAPSYNTLSSQFLIIALAGTGSLLTYKQFSIAQLTQMIISAIAWALVTMAYPSLLGAWFFLCCLILLYRTTFSRPWAYLGLLISACGIGWFILVTSLSFNRLYQSALYLSAINDTADFIRKGEFAFMLFKLNTTFTYLFILAILLGIFRNHIVFYWRSIAMSAIFLALLFIPPTFLTHSHDAFTLASLMGLGLLSGFKRNATPNARIIAIIYGISLIASVLTCLTAANSVFNFCIGSVPAASLAVLGPPSTANKKFNIMPAITFIFAILSTSLFLFYGELPGKKPQKRHFISHGFFAGLFVRDNDIELLQWTEKFISPLLEKDNSVAIFARNPGIVLVTPGRLKMLAPYALMPSVTKKGLEFTHAFYIHPENRPKLVLIYRDPYLEPINPMQLDFSSWYILSSTFKTSDGGELSVYLRKK